MTRAGPLVHVWVTTSPESPIFVPGETPVKGEAGRLTTRLPIVIWVFGNWTRMDDIIAALEHNDCVCMSNRLLGRYRSLGSNYSNAEAHFWH